MSRVCPYELVDRLIFQARAAARCREAARGDVDADTRDALMRAADRYSAGVAELAGEIVRGRQ